MVIYKTKSDNVPAIILVNRLKTFVSLTDVCNYIGIQVPDLVNIKNVDASREFKNEKDRDLDYHLKKIKYFIKNGIDKPIDIDCLSINGKIYPFPVILDGRHRYIAALLRRDEKIRCTYSGLDVLIEYLTGIRDHV